MGNAEPLRDIYHSGLAILSDKVVNHLYVIFSELLRSGLACPTVRLRRYLWRFKRTGHRLLTSSTFRSF
jgi:hypothetical protein